MDMDAAARVRDAVSAGNARSLAALRSELGDDRADDLTLACLADPALCGQALDLLGPRAAKMGPAVRRAIAGDPPLLLLWWAIRHGHGSTEVLAAAAARGYASLLPRNPRIAMASSWVLEACARAASSGDHVQVFEWAARRVDPPDWSLLLAPASGAPRCYAFAVSRVFRAVAGRYALAFVAEDPRFLRVPTESARAALVSTRASFVAWAGPQCALAAVPRVLDIAFSKEPEEPTDVVEWIGRHRPQPKGVVRALAARHARGSPAFVEWAMWQGGAGGARRGLRMYILRRYIVQRNRVGTLDRLHRRPGDPVLHLPTVLRAKPPGQVVAWAKSARSDVKYARDWAEIDACLSELGG